jgi:hypothetical protein
MAGRKNIKIKMPKSPLPKPSKIGKRGLYEMMWGAKTRDYGKRLGIK